MPGRKPCAVNNRCVPLHLDVPPQRRFLRPSLQTTADYCFPSSVLDLLSWVETLSLTSKGLRPRGQYLSGLWLWRHINNSSQTDASSHLKSTGDLFISFICLAAAQEWFALNKTAVITKHKNATSYAIHKRDNRRVRRRKCC